MPATCSARWPASSLRPWSDRPGSCVSRYWRRLRRWRSCRLRATTRPGSSSASWLAAPVGQNSPGWAGTGAWILVGICAVPASAIWAALGHRWTRPSLLIAALILQAIGIGLPAVVGGIGPELVGAALFGSTFLGIG